MITIPIFIISKVIFFVFHTTIEVIRGGSRAATTSKMECFMIIVNGLLSQSTPSWMLQQH